MDNSAASGAGPWWVCWVRCAEGTAGGGDGTIGAAPSASPDDLWRVSSGWQPWGEQERCHIVHEEVPAREAGGPAACSDPRARTVESATPERLPGAGQPPRGQGPGAPGPAPGSAGVGWPQTPPTFSPTSFCPPRPPPPAPHLLDLYSTSSISALQSPPQLSGLAITPPTAW